MARPYHINLDAEDKANALLVNGFVDDTAAGSPTIYRSDVYPSHWICFRRDAEGRLINVAAPTTLKVFAGELDAAPTGGTFTISSDVETTAAIAYNASAATVQAAVRAALVTDFSNATVTGPNGGPWVITAVGAGPLAYDLEVDPTALSPVQSTAQVINTEGDADHDMQWEISLFRAYLMFRGSGWSALPSAAVTADIIQAGSANANKVYEVSWNRDAYAGTVTLSVLADAVTASVGPFPFNATEDEIKTAFEAHSGIEVDEVTVKQTDIGKYVITFAGGSLAASNSPTISTSSNTLDVPVGLSGTLAVSTHGANQILNGETEETIAFEVEIQENTGEPETVVHIEDAILKADGIHNNPGQSTGNENYPQLENVLWSNTTITEYTGGDAEDLDSIATVDRSPGQYIAFAHATDGLRFYELISSTDAESSPTTIRPDDYNGTTNQKVWRLQGQDASNITIGALLAARGGTGQSSYTIGDLLYASTSTALSKLAGVATGNALISGGVGTAPSWGKIALTTHVSGTLPAANGGTGRTSSPTFSAHKNGTDQTGVVTSTFTKVTFGAEDWDTGSYFASSTFTPLVAGTYLLTAFIRDNSGGGAYSLQVVIYKNGAAHKFIGQSNNDGIVGGCCLVDANGSTDTFEVYAWQNSGADLTIGGAATQTYFQGNIVC